MMQSLDGQRVTVIVLYILFSWLGYYKTLGDIQFKSRVMILLKQAKEFYYIPLTNPEYVA